MITENILSMNSIYTKLFEIETKGENAALCVVIETHGSTPLKSGAKMIVRENASLVGTIGGGNLEKSVIEAALQVIKEGKPKVFTHNLVKDHQMCCGGKVLIYIEPVSKVKNLYIFGAGHIGKQLAKLACDLNFKISLVDAREEMFSEFVVSGVDKQIVNHQEFLDRASFDENTFIVICTHLHELDREILAYCINKPNTYLGMIGSLRKVGITRKIFTEQKIANKELLDFVDMPMGYDIGGQRPEEIALGIMAKLVAVKNKKNIVENISKAEKDIIDEYEKSGCTGNGSS